MYEMYERLGLELIWLVIPAMMNLCVGIFCVIAFASVESKFKELKEELHRYTNTHKTSEVKTDEK